MGLCLPDRYDMREREDNFKVFLLLLVYKTNELLLLWKTWQKIKEHVFVFQHSI
jgi:hypothetical protein